jgi:Cyclin, N-terminal domain
MENSQQVSFWSSYFDCLISSQNIFLSRFRDLMCGPHILSRPSPIPALAWADSSLLWQSMMAPDIKSKDSRSSKMFETNPEVQPKMRSILLDWLIEVAEVYKLHRETYYLAQDYVDRVLSASKETPKSELQLLGMSCEWIFSQHFLHVLFFFRRNYVFIYCFKS